MAPSSSTHLRGGLAHLNILCCVPILSLAIGARIPHWAGMAAAKAVLLCCSADIGLAEAGPRQAVMALDLWRGRPPASMNHQANVQGRSVTHNINLL